LVLHCRQGCSVACRGGGWHGRRSPLHPGPARPSHSGRVQLRPLCPPGRTSTCYPTRTCVEPTLLQPSPPASSERSRTRKRSCEEAGPAGNAVHGRGEDNRRRPR
jgi:hypothetical protein